MCTESACYPLFKRHFEYMSSEQFQFIPVKCDKDQPSEALPCYFITDVNDMSWFEINVTSVNLQLHSISQRGVLFNFIEMADKESFSQVKLGKLARGFLI